jgi:hypothetical protein
MHGVTCTAGKYVQVNIIAGLVGSGSGIIAERRPLVIVLVLLMNTGGGRYEGHAERGSLAPEVAESSLLVLSFVMD